MLVSQPFKRESVDGEGKLRDNGVPCSTQKSSAALKYTFFLSHIDFETTFKGISFFIDGSSQLCKFFHYSPNIERFLWDPHLFTRL